MSAVEDGVLILGATNIPWGLDPAVRRRFERRIYIPLPDAAARRALLGIHLGRTPHSLGASDLSSLAARCDGLSGADVSVLVRDALMEPVREMQHASYFAQDADGNWFATSAGARGAQRMGLMDVPAQRLKAPTVTAAHFERALKAVRPTVGLSDLVQHEQFTKEFGSG